MLLQEVYHKIPRTRSFIQRDKSISVVGKLGLMSRREFFCRISDNHLFVARMVDLIFNNFRIHHIVPSHKSVSNFHRKYLYHQ